MILLRVLGAGVVAVHRSKERKAVVVGVVVQLFDLIGGTRLEYDELMSAPMFLSLACRRQSPRSAHC